MSKDLEITNKGNLKIVTELASLINNIEYEINNGDIEKSEVTQYRFKLRHFKNALKIIKLFPDKIKQGNDLKDISGIGKGIISRIDEIIETKQLAEVDKTKMKEITKELNVIDELSEVINIGSKVAKQFIEKYDIKSVNELKSRIKKGEIEVNDKIKMGLKYHGKIFTNIPRTEMDIYNEKLQEYVSKLNKKLTLIVAGSYRRGKKTSNDIDVLITHKDISTNKEYEKIDINYLELFVLHLKKNKVIVDDLTDTDNGTKYMGFCKLPRRKIRRIDIRFVPNNYFNAALLYFTGSYELNTQMRQLAKTMDYKLNEYGLFKKKKDGTYSDEPIKVNSESDIFKKLKLDYLEPNQRG